MAWQSPKTNWATPDGVAASDMNRIEGNSQFIKTGAFVQTAAGTGTAITLADVELVAGKSVTFVVNTNNSAAATTINGKQLYKPGTTSAPKLIVGKAVTVWYSSSGDCFYIADDIGDALMPGTQGGIGDIIPTNADLLGGKNKGYFEALVDAVSQRVTENLTAINTINNNLAKFILNNISSTAFGYDGSNAFNIDFNLPNGTIAKFVIENTGLRYLYFNGSEWLTVWTK